MNRFSKLLNEINKKLDLPQPHKSRIMLELSADLNDTYEYYLDKGLTPENAMKQAEEKFAPTNKSMEELTMTHQTNFRKFVDKVSQYQIKAWETGMLCVVMISLVFLSMTVVSSDEPGQLSSVYNWPILGFIIVATLIFVYKIYTLYIKQDHRISQLRRGLNWLLVLSGMSLVTASMGYLIDLYSLSETPFIFLNNIMMMTITMTDQITPELLVQIAQWFSQTMAMIMFGMLSSIISAVFWFILENKVIKIEIAESSYLLSE